jgi:hypothetical protein
MQLGLDLNPDSPTKEFWMNLGQVKLNPRAIGFLIHM